MHHVADTAHRCAECDVILFNKIYALHTLQLLLLLLQPPLYFYLFINNNERYFKVLKLLDYLIIIRLFYLFC